MFENYTFTGASELIHWGLVTPYGVGDLGQHWLRKWLVAWRHQAITWTNVDLSWVRSSGIHLSAFLQEIPQPSVTKIHLKIIHLKFHSNFPGTNELSDVIQMLSQCCWNQVFWSLIFHEQHNVRPRSLTFLFRNVTPGIISMILICFHLVFKFTTVYCRKNGYNIMQY